MRHNGLVRRSAEEAWAYNSGASVLLGTILKEATGRDLLSYAREVLFDPLGIGTVYWEQTAGGHYQTGGGLSMPPRDMARLGTLMLQNGTWNGRQILSSAWVSRSTQAYYPAHSCYDYGHQWWILPGGQGYQANGLYGQRIYILPQADMVVVTTASISGETLYQIDGLLHTFILPACTDLLQQPRPRIYDAYGFTLEYPAGLCLESGPLPGHTRLSNASGLVQITSNIEPVEMLLRVWNEVEVGRDASSFLEAYLAGLAATGVGVRPGETAPGSQDGHAMVLRFSELDLGAATVPALSGAWICRTSGREFAVTYLTAAGGTPQDLRAGLERYLAGLACH